MATIKIKRQSANDTPGSLEHGELGVSKNKLFFGNSDNSTIEVISKSFDGKVGINTNTPEFDIDVQGDLRLRDENPIFFGGNGSEAKSKIYYNENEDSIDFVIFD